MFGARWQLFRLFGIPISVDVSWIIILALLTFSLASGFPDLMHRYFPGTEQLPVYAYWIMGLVTTLAFFACILLHEFGHTFVGRALGMRIEGITLFLFGGVSELREEPASAGVEFLMAIAGPAVSLLLAALLCVLAIVGYQGGWPDAVVVVLGYLATINVVVLVFNMIPAFPLDGGRVLRSILWGLLGRMRVATYWASLAGRVFAWFLIGLGILQLFSGQWQGILTCLIGLFLNNAARSGYQQVLVREALSGEPVQRFMNPHPIVVDSALDLVHWVEEYVYRYHHRSFPVVSNERLEGMITTQVLNQIPRSEWSKHTVGEVMTTSIEEVSIPATTDALEALSKMQRTNSSRLLVTEGDHLVGMVTVKDLLRFLDLKLELESKATTINRRHFSSVGAERQETLAGRQ
jgi:Zn-dependent protease/CBS domain-containing protein